MSSLYFYDQLATFKNFKDFTNLNLYLDAPENWYVVITDVVNSTKAIKKGKNIQLLLWDGLLARPL